MKRFLIRLLLIGGLLFPSTAFAMEGVIAMINDDKIVVCYHQYGWEYYALGTFSSYVPYGIRQGDIVYGYLARYGHQTLFDETAEQELSVYIDSYDNDEKEAMAYVSDSR